MKLLMSSHCRRYVWSICRTIDSESSIDKPGHGNHMDPARCGLLNESNVVITKCGIYGINARLDRLTYPHMNSVDPTICPSFKKDKKISNKIHEINSTSYENCNRNASYPNCQKNNVVMTTRGMYGLNPRLDKLSYTYVETFIEKLRQKFKPINLDSKYRYDKVIENTHRNAINNVLKSKYNGIVSKYTASVSLATDIQELKHDQNTIVSNVNSTIKGKTIILDDLHKDTIGNQCSLVKKHNQKIIKNMEINSTEKIHFLNMKLKQGEIKTIKNNQYNDQEQVDDKIIYQHKIMLNKLEKEPSKIEHRNISNNKKVKQLEINTIKKNEYNNQEKEIDVIEIRKKEQRVIYSNKECKTIIQDKISFDNYPELDKEIKYRKTVLQSKSQKQNNANSQTRKEGFNKEISQIKTNPDTDKYELNLNKLVSNIM